MIVKTLEWIGQARGYLNLIDQRKLPDRFEHLKCRTIEQVYHAIQTLTVRGAPAIGVSAAYGVCLGIKELDKDTPAEDTLAKVESAAEYLAASRPTAVNLFWALDRMKRTAHALFKEDTPPTTTQIKTVLLEEAHKICAEDQAMCRAIGENGLRYIEPGTALLTHCNAGALATAGQGTALSPMYEAHRKGLVFRVFVDETRPLLQGARLTAWELTRAGIPATLICDNMAGMLMKQGKISAVITGADRIAANGDAANKIGTYALSVLARVHEVPFYIAAPSSTFDLSIATGSLIPIEQRSADEVRAFRDAPSAPEDIDVFNPAFDVTPAENITAIITEKGVIEKPNRDTIAAHLRSPDA